MDKVNDSSEPLVPRHGGYRRLVSFRVAQIVFDVTVRFCDRYVGTRSRTHDQMVQAARSGVQNIAEGSQASGTSRKTELKLTNVARASLEELRLDYEDFLRQRGMPLWDRRDPRRQRLIDRRPADADAVAAWARDVYQESRDRWQGGQSGRSGQSGPSGLCKPDEQGKQNESGEPCQQIKHKHPAEQKVAVPTISPDHPIAPSRLSTSSTSSTSSTPSTSSTAARPATYPEIAANGALALIDVATALLDRQLAAQARAFEQEGGFTERLYRVRTDRRRNQR